MSFKIPNLQVFYILKYILLDSDNLSGQVKRVRFRHYTKYYLVCSQEGSQLRRKSIQCNVSAVL